jgi:hypothetical protein
MSALGDSIGVRRLRRRAERGSRARSRASLLPTARAHTRRRARVTVRVARRARRGRRSRSLGARQPRRRAATRKRRTTARDSGRTRRRIQARGYSPAQSSACGSLCRPESPPREVRHESVEVRSWPFPIRVSGCLDDIVNRAADPTQISDALQRLRRQDRIKCTRAAGRRATSRGTTSSPPAPRRTRVGRAPRAAPRSRREAIAAASTCVRRAPAASRASWSDPSAMTRRAGATRDPGARRGPARGRRRRRHGIRTRPRAVPRSRRRERPREPGDKRLESRRGVLARIVRAGATAAAKPVRPLGHWTPEASQSAPRWIFSHSGNRRAGCARRGTRPRPSRGSPLPTARAHAIPPTKWPRRPARDPARILCVGATATARAAKPRRRAERGSGRAVRAGSSIPTARAHARPRGERLELRERARRARQGRRRRALAEKQPRRRATAGDGQPRCAGRRGPARERRRRRAGTPSARPDATRTRLLDPDGPRDRATNGSPCANGRDSRGEAGAQNAGAGRDARDGSSIPTARAPTREAAAA